MPAKLDLNEVYLLNNDKRRDVGNKLAEEFRRKTCISMDSPSSDDIEGRLGTNTTERVAVPSSEHVAEIVGRQGYKIKALRTSTNTYIRTPVRGEEPAFVVTGRKEGVAKAKEYILASAQHFTQIRANRGANSSPVASTPTTPSVSPSASAPTLGQVTAEVRVPASLVGLVIGPKGSTIKRIQKQTYTFIMTPNREMDPVFRVTGLPANVEMAKLEIQSHIISRTAGRAVTPLADPPAVDDSSLSQFYQAGKRQGICREVDKENWSLPFGGDLASCGGYFNGDHRNAVVGSAGFYQPLAIQTENVSHPQQNPYHPHQFPMSAALLQRVAADIFQMSPAEKEQCMLWQSEMLQLQNNWPRYQSKCSMDSSPPLSLWSGCDPSFSGESSDGFYSAYSLASSSSPECFM